MTKKELNEIEARGNDPDLSYGDAYDFYMKDIPNLVAEVRRLWNWVGDLHDRPRRGGASD